MLRQTVALAAILLSVWVIADGGAVAVVGDVSASPSNDVVILRDASAPPIDDVAAKPWAGPRVPVRVAYHRGYNRIVFDWRLPVDYSISRTGGRVVVRFDRAARIDLATLTAQPPTDVYSAEAALDGKQTSVTLSIDPPGRLRHFRSGTQVVLDVFLAPARAVAEAGPRSDQTIPVAKAALSPSPASNL